MGQSIRVHGDVMKYKKIKTVDGEVIEQLIPESREDEEYLAQKDIEVPGSFADDEDQKETIEFLGFE